MTATKIIPSSIDYLALGQRLRAYRIGASLTADHVAEKLGVSRVVVYRMEKGEIVKIETLERLANLLGTSMASLLGVEVEYHSTVLGFVERMRQLEQNSVRIISHFEPISLLLTSPRYLGYLREMLLEAAPRGTDENDQVTDIEKMIGILAERKAFFEKHRPHIVSLIGLRELERFVHMGLIGRLDLPSKLRAERILAARQEVLHMADLMECDSMDVQIGLIDDPMPTLSFQVFAGINQSVLALSPFRFGELPNIRNGIATVTASAEALRVYKDMIGRLWEKAVKGTSGAQQLHQLLERIR